MAGDLPITHKICPPIRRVAGEKSAGKFASQVGGDSLGLSSLCTDGHQRARIIPQPGLMAAPGVVPRRGARKMGECEVDSAWLITALRMSQGKRF